MQASVRLDATPSWTLITEASDLERATSLIRAALTVQLTGYRPAVWGRKAERCFLLRRGGQASRFATGFLPRVVSTLRAAGWRVDVRSTPPVPRLPAVPSIDRLNGIDNLHAHQDEAAARALPVVRARIQVGTTGGKTEVGAELVRRLSLRTLWTTNSVDLQMQTVDRLRLRLGADAVGTFQRGIDSPPTALVCVATVQALHAARKTLPVYWWRQWRVVIADECQLASAKTWYQTILRCGGAWHRYGLSGTVLTGKLERDWMLEGATGVRLDIIGVAGLAERGLAALPELRMVRVPPAAYPSYHQARAAVCPRAHLMLQRAAHTLDDAEAQRLRAAARYEIRANATRLWSWTYQHGITHNQQRNAAALKLLLQLVSHDNKVLVLCSNLAHGAALERALRQRNVRVAWLSGQDSKTLRAGTLRAFRTANSGAVLIASKIFNAGIDAPEIDAGVLLGGGGRTSPVDTIQKVGRMVRWRADKTTVPVYDFLDGTGPPRPGVKDYLAAHTAARVAAYRRAGYPVVAWP